MSGWLAPAVRHRFGSYAFDMQHRDLPSGRRAELAGSFGPAAETYERGRPGYPDDVIDWLVPPGAGRVIDVGAGTGKLTRQLLDRGLEVTAVDPSEEMLTVLRRVAPRAEARSGTAERIPLPDGSADLVVAAQSWHWADPEVGSREFARVLRAGGTAGLVWNFADESVEWVARLGAAFTDGGAISRATELPGLSSPFADVERFDTRFTVRMTRSDVTDMVSSRSYVISATDEQRSRVLAEVDGVLDELLPDGVPALEFPYVTVAFRAVRPTG